MPEDLKQTRNNSIILSIIEFICCFLSVIMYVRRRSRIILVIIIFNLIISVNNRTGRYLVLQVPIRIFLIAKFLLGEEKCAQTNFRILIYFFLCILEDLTICLAFF